MIVTIGTNDTLASPGAQLDYYQSVIDKMGRATVDAFARLVRDAADRSRPRRQQLRRGRQRARRFRWRRCRTDYDRLDLLMDWVENKKAPQMQ